MQLLVNFYIFLKFHIFFLFFILFWFFTLFLWNLHLVVDFHNFIYNFLLFLISFLFPLHAFVEFTTVCKFLHFFSEILHFPNFSSFLPFYTFCGIYYFSWIFPLFLICLQNFYAHLVLYNLQVFVKIHVFF